jgi:uncharacterized protein YhbP (UPF0306 family)
MLTKDDARQLIKISSWITLATTDGVKPWTTTVYFGLDDKDNLYFVASVKSLHSQNILKNANVAGNIFDADAISGEANSVQISGICERLLAEELQLGIDAVYSRRYPDPIERARHNITVEQFSKPDTDPTAQYIFKVKPVHTYLLDKTVSEDDWIEV